MIELGAEVFRGAHTPFDRTEHIQDAHLVSALLATTAELRQRGVNVPELLAPLTTSMDVVASVTGNPRQHKQLASLQNRLADKFSTDDRELKPEDFGVISMIKNGAPEVYVALTTPTGLFRGSYHAIMSRKRGNTAAYTVKVGGQRVDTREAMSRRLHRAINVQALAGYIALGPAQPDSESDSDTSMVTVRSGTWYTGDRPEELIAPFGYDDEVYPERQWRP